MKKCCASTPRCSRCPVLLKARARARAGATGQAALVQEILAGSSRGFPTCVTEALDALSAVRDQVRSPTCFPSVSPMR